jgi:hypothetical protein
MGVESNEDDGVREDWIVSESRARQVDQRGGDRKRESHLTRNVKWD